MSTQDVRNLAGLIVVVTFGFAGVMWLMEP